MELNELLEHIDIMKIKFIKIVYSNSENETRTIQNSENNIGGI